METALSVHVLRISWQGPRASQMLRSRPYASWHSAHARAHNYPVVISVRILLGRQQNYSTLYLVYTITPCTRVSQMVCFIGHRSHACLSTTPTAGHVLSAQAHNWLSTCTQVKVVTKFMHLNSSVRNGYTTRAGMCSSAL